MSPKLLFILR